MSSKPGNSENSLNWLLEPDDPGVRYLALRDLLGLPCDDPTLCDARKIAHEEGPISHVLNRMDPQGFWSKPGPGYGVKYRSTVWAIILLAQLGASITEDQRIGLACNYLVDHAFAKGGKFTHAGSPSGTFDCLQGNLCWALTELGYADPRLDEAYRWLSISQTGDGVAPKTDKSAPVRYYAYKCGPGFLCGANYNLPCAWGATKVLMALGNLTAAKQTDQSRKATKLAVDFFFSVEPSTAAWPYKEILSKNWWKFGFPVFYNTDLLQVAEALTAVGYGNDPRLAQTISLIRSKQDAQGRWPLEYDVSKKTWGNYGTLGAPNKWVTLRALRVLKEIKT
ncbi:MAG: hypothetical protein MUO40_02520 [Anaerolineaceae bacterium]|nr:hypothetical protein [Anaerolineaceae bacterium]